LVTNEQEARNLHKRWLVAIVKMQYYKMKKYYLVLLLSSSFSPSITQKEYEAASALLDSISQHSLQATFTYTSRSSQLELLESFEGGQITIQGNKCRLTLPTQEVINDGQTVWTYLRDANEVQIADHDPEQEAITPWTIFANYRRDYTLCRFNTHQEKGHVYDSVTLLAKDAENSLHSVSITVEHATKHIVSLEVMDSNQTLHVFMMTDFAYDLKLDKTFFSFNVEAHQGVEVIDMR
jgi:outer membrane lipoprotein carrier protein